MDHDRHVRIHDRGLAFVVYLIMRPPTEHMIAQRTACDRAVEAVMTSDDVIEVERGDIIIRELGCDLGRRIGPGGTFQASQAAAGR